MKIPNGIFPVLKPCGITSSQFLESIKEKLRTDMVNNQKHIKMGHGGTLDKMACGVLVVGIGSGCSSLPAFLDGVKQYKTDGIFGIATDTYNKQGTVTQKKSFEHITLEKIKFALHTFNGKIMQKPPAYSALKLNGRRLSDLCREGIVVDPSPRAVVCHWINITHYDPPYFTLELKCGRGFYVRSLVHDLGVILGSCAHVEELERTVQGPFSVSDCLTEEQITLSSVITKMEITKKKLKSYLDVAMHEFRRKHNRTGKEDGS